MSPAGPGSSPLWPAASLHAGCSHRKSNTDDFIILPSDLSGILSCSPPPPSSLPPPTDTYTLLLYILPHCISRSPCLSFHHTPSRPILPHFPAPLPTPRAFFIAKFNTHFKVKCQCVCVCVRLLRSLLSCGRCRGCCCTHLAAASIRSHPSDQWGLGCLLRGGTQARTINRLQYGFPGNRE